MAKIIPIDVIKGISGSYGHGSNDYFATNTSSSKVRLAKLAHPYKGPATEKQTAQREKFKARQAAATAWLNANKPSATNGSNGTALYQQAQKMKKAQHLSTIQQVLYQHMDDSNKIVLPNDTTSGTSASGGSSTGTGSGSGSVDDA